MQSDIQMGVAQMLMLYFHQSTAALQLAVVGKHADLVLN